MLSYNDLQFYNPDYSEIHYNYGIIFTVLFQMRYTIDRELLKEYKAALNELKGKDYDFDLAILEKNKNLNRVALAPTDPAKNYLVPDEDRAQITDLIKSLNTIDSDVSHLDIHKLIVPARGNVYDKLLLDLSAYSLEYAAVKVEHKPNVWYQFLDTMLKCGRFEEGVKWMEYVYDLDGEVVESGEKPIYTWPHFERKYDKQIFGMMIQFYDKTGKSDELITAISRRLQDNPKNEYYVNLMLSYGPARLPEKPDAQLPAVNRLTHFNPLNWRYHDKMARFYAGLAQKNIEEAELKDYLLQQLASLMRVEVLAKSGKLTIAAASLPTMGYKTSRPELSQVYETMIRSLQILAMREKDKSQKAVFIDAGLHYSSEMMTITDDAKVDSVQAKAHQRAVIFLSQFKSLKRQLNKPAPVVNKKKPVKKPKVNPALKK